MLVEMGDNSIQIFFDYKRMHKVRIKVARIFNTYGPSMDIDDGRVISNFIVQALQGKNITKKEIKYGLPKKTPGKKKSRVKKEKSSKEKQT